MTFDLTKNKIPFGLLDEGTQKDFKNYSGVFEYWTCTHGWMRVDEPTWLSDLVYRVKPEPREFWIVSEDGQSFYDKGIAKQYAFNIGSDLIHVREVLE